MFKQGHKHCFKQDLSSASKQDTSTCTYVRTDGLTKNYSPLEHVLTLANVRGGAAKNG